MRRPESFFCLCSDTELLVHWSVLVFCFSVFALYGGAEPHFSCETLRVDAVQPHMACSITNELRMVLLASHQMKKKS